MPTTVTSSNQGMAGSTDSWNTHWGKERRGEVISSDPRTGGKLDNSLGMARTIQDKGNS